MYLWQSVAHLAARQVHTTMSQAHKLDCESEALDCRFIVQSENETEAIELARKHLWAVHGRDYSTDELREEHLQVI